VASLILSQLEYGNAMLAGLPRYLLDKLLQSVQDVAARVIFLPRKYDYVTPLL